MVNTFSHGDATKAREFSGPVQTVPFGLRDALTAEHMYHLTAFCSAVHMLPEHFVLQSICYQRCRPAFTNSSAGIGILQTKGQALAFARPGFELCQRC